MFFSHVINNKKIGSNSLIVKKNSSIIYINSPVCVCHHCTNRGHWEMTIISFTRILHLGLLSLNKSFLYKGL